MEQCPHVPLHKTACASHTSFEKEQGCSPLPLQLLAFCRTRLAGVLTGVGFEAWALAPLRLRGLVTSGLLSSSGSSCCSAVSFAILRRPLMFFSNILDLLGVWGSYDFSVGYMNRGSGAPILGFSITVVDEELLSFF